MQVRARLLDAWHAVRCYPAPEAGRGAPDGGAPQAHVVVGSAAVDWEVRVPGQPRRWWLELVVPFQVLVLELAGHEPVAAALAPEGEVAWRLQDSGAGGRVAAQAALAGCRRVGPDLEVQVRLGTRLALWPPGEGTGEYREEVIAIRLAPGGMTAPPPPSPTPPRAAPPVP